MPHVIVIGAGFAGLSAACHLAKGGATVTLVERHPQPGGRARTWESDGFRFDMGPSWYWMPDIFDRFFAHFGRKVHDEYDLIRLDPSYRVVWPGGDAWDIPARMEALRDLFAAHQADGGPALDRFLTRTQTIYETAVGDYLLRPSLGFTEFVDRGLVTGLVRLQMLTSMRRFVGRYFTDPRLARLAEWPVLFLGAAPQDTSAMYSLMSYADMALGTWYPRGGMHRIIEAMVGVATDLGVEIRLDSPVSEIVVEGGRAVGVVLPTQTLRADAVLAAADYHHVETALLAPEHRQISDRAWAKKAMSPSSLLIYLGIEGKIPDIPHHTLFFDEDLDTHMREVYQEPQWPERPLFYVCAPSVTDPACAPEGCENLFVLVPLAPGLPDSDEARARCADAVLARLEAHTKVPIREQIVVRRDYAMRNFVEDYGAFKGNAYGMANTLMQTGPFKPPLRSKRVGGLYFAGQLTVPGPGMPPSLISGELSAKVLLEELGQRRD